MPEPLLYRYYYGSYAKSHTAKILIALTLEIDRS